MARFSKNRLFSRFVGKLNQSSQITSTGIASGAVDEGVTVYDSAGLLPSSGMSAGDQAWSGNRLYISNGSGWYNVALVNANPRFVSIVDSDGGTTPFALATDGTPTTITLLGADSDGVDVTYSYTKDAGFDGLATISGSGTEYTVTPLSEDSATTSSGTVTFKVSDGISFASSVNTFTLSFISWDPSDFVQGSYPSTALYGVNYGGIGREGSIWVSEDGYKAAILGRNTTPNTAYSLDLSTPYDISSSNVTTSGSSTLNSRVSYGGAILFSDDGYTFWVWDASGQKKIYEYTLSTAFDLDTLSTGSEVIHTMAGGVLYAFNMGFSSDGYKFYAHSTHNKKIDVWSLSTAYDLSTVTIVHNGVSLPSLTALGNSNHAAAFIDPTGTKFAIIHVNPNDAADEQWTIYNIPTAWDPTSLTDASRIGTLSLGLYGSYTFNGMWMPNGLNMYYFDRAGGYFRRWYVS